MDLEFIEWYKLHLDIRADLLTVVEDVRPGANIELWKIAKRESDKSFVSQKTLLEYCLGRLGLKFRVHDDNYYVSKDESLLDDLWSGKIKSGDFLGYPKCCITAFEDGCRAMMDGDNDCAPAVRYCREVEKVLDRDDFDRSLLFNQHVPCCIDCLESLKLATRNADLLETHDIEAAYYLRDYNLNMVYQFAYKYPQKGGKMIKKCVKRGRTKGPLKIQTIFYFVHDNGDGSASTIFFTDRKKAQKRLNREEENCEQLSDGSLATLEIEINPATGEIVSGVENDEGEYDEDSSHTPDEPQGID